MNMRMPLRLITLVIALLVLLIASTSTVPAASRSETRDLWPLDAPNSQWAWQLHYADEFNASGDLSGWTIDRGGGNYWIDTGGWIPTFGIALV